MGADTTNKPSLAFIFLPKELTELALTEVIAGYSTPLLSYLYTTLEDLDPINTKLESIDIEFATLGIVIV